MTGLPALKALREQADLSQQDLAKLAGLTPATISYVETGKVSPNLETLQAIATALGTTVGTLLGECCLPATGTDGAA